ncbi:MAG: HEAT repeat domain-containing protein [Anaerolineae bacterium]
MAKSRRLEDRLAALDDLRADPTSEESIEALRRALTSKVNHIVGRAAQISGEFWLEELEPDLVDAFERFMINAAKTDPACIAKTAIAEALYRMEAYQPEVYLDAIGHVQLEPTYGGQEDTAAKLRGISALGLVRIDYPNVMILLAQLLADPEADARIAAARAIGYAGLDAGTPLLRFKALIGDDHPQVLADTFVALLKLAPDSSLSFVAGFLQRADVTVQEAAAVALGESRLVQAFPFLETAWEDTRDADLRRTFLLAIALLRQDRATDFLISLVREGGPDGEDALGALRMYQDDLGVWDRVERALAARALKEGEQQR